MGENSKIQWTHHTWNFWRGCSKESDGCKHCYAWMLSKRNPGVLGQWGPEGTRVMAAESHWRLPYRWNRQAQEAGERRRVFSLSLGDVWEGEDTMPQSAHESVRLARMRALGIMSETPWLDYLLVTKRPQNIVPYLRQIQNDLSNGYGGFSPEAAGRLACVVNRWLQRDPPRNVWLGASVENAEERMRAVELNRVPAVLRFLSCEPLLGDLRFDEDFYCCKVCGCPLRFNPEIDEALLSPKEVEAYRCFEQDGCPDCSAQHGRYAVANYLDMIDWVVCGGESGSRARPMNAVWARSLRDQCGTLEIPFFFKQAGTHLAREWGCSHPKGGDIDEMPADLRLREFPVVNHDVAV